MQPAVLCILAACLAASPVLAQGTQFVIRTPPALVQPMIEVVAADFDGDGDLDLCGARPFFSNPPQILLRNDGAGHFVDVSANLPPLPGWATSATVPFDMDGDGDLDIFLAGAGARLLRNVGNLTFVNASGNLPAGLGSTSAAKAVDVDGDGDLDLVVVSPIFGFSGVLSNQGGGVFVVSPAAQLPSGTAVVAADFDGDGDPDLAISGIAFALMRNDGGPFTNVTQLWAPGFATGTAYFAIPGDFDGNSWPDLWVGTPGNYQQLRNLNGTFVVAGTLPIASPLISGPVVDVDDDGDPDVVFGCQTGAVQLGINDGSGNFTLAPSRLSLPVVQNPTVAAGDFDGDGDIDLVVADQASPIRMLMNRHRDLVPGQPVIGQNWNVQIASEPGYATLDHVARLAIAVAALPGPQAVPGFGDLWLDLAGGYAFFESIVFASAGQCTFSFAVPLAPGLVGLPLHVQGLVEQARAPARFTPYFRVVVQ